MRDSGSRGLLSLVFVLALGACSPGVRATSFVSFSPRPDDHPIQVYRSTIPECQFEEVGIVSSRRESSLVSMDKVLEALRSKARELGGDAVIGMVEANEARNVILGVDRDTVLSGTIIRFTDQDCQR